MDDSLFGRGRGDDVDDVGVDRVFADAIDRQVAEQQGLNRWLESADQRLEDVDTGLRALRETHATQTVALRAEVQEALARLTEEVNARFRQLAEEVDRLRQGSTDHAVRLVQMAQATDDAVAGLVERHRELGGQLGGLESRLESQVDDGSRFAALAEAVASLRDDIGNQVSAIRSHVDGSLRQVGEHIGTVDEHVGTVAERLDEHGDRLVAAFQDAERHREPPIEPSALAATVTADVAARVSEILSERLDDARRGADARSDDVAAQLERLGTALRSRTEAITERLDRLAHTLGERAPDLEPLQAEIAALRDEAAQLRTDTGNLRNAVSDDLQQVAAPLHARLTALGADLEDVLSGHLRRAAAIEQEEREHAARGLTEHVAAVLEALETQTDRVVALDGRLRGLEDGGRDQLELLDALRSSQQRSADDVRGQHEELRAVLAGSLDPLRADVAAYGQQVGSIAREIERALVAESDRRSEHLAAIEERDASSRRALDELASQVADEVRSSWRTTSDELTAGWTASAHDVEAMLQERLARLGEVVEQRVPDVLAEHRREQAATLQDALDAAGARFDDATTSLRRALDDLSELAPLVDARADDAVDRATQEVRREATGAMREVRAIGSYLQQLAEYHERLEGSLVAYLEARDARLERERHQVLVELIEEFAAGLSRRERRKLGGRLESARERVIGTAQPPAPTPTDTADDAENETATGTGLLAALLGELEEDEEAIAPAHEPPAGDPDDPYDVLGGIRGLGRSKQDALLDQFGSVEAIAAATEDELMAVPGIGPAIARSVRHRLAPED